MQPAPDVIRGKFRYDVMTVAIAKEIPPIQAVLIPGPGACEMGWRARYRPAVSAYSMSLNRCYLLLLLGPWGAVFND